ncbi:MarR family winged helix-turn-helix transcriptional regulator [Novosphingobium cyanobacteriorum]|uniref:MarR family winged helix-turn-helix transcriptional regulator n=1 Tax=Novosphingobium cyanobacteriorum TaxID=3024215 RepID=A0ABT6CJI8_9SPHN|nr:MarR family winged helix-turn-helix transcriptional regulator [Novosphingobium cyanobacteriorum]MDF8332507.1 MarR family winged helix-turn-helix transcriptional regulator [Novosphingobium cyanobacteriorum]
MGNGSTSTGIAEAPQAQPGRVPVDFDADATLLVDLLKLATFIGAPMRESVAEPLGLTPTDLRVILALGGEGELAGHDLSEIMGVPPMNVSRALASLLDRGLVEPGADPANRRRKPFRLTEHGADIFRHTAPALAKVGASLFGGMPDDDRAAFHRAAQAVLAKLTGR